MECRGYIKDVAIDHITGKTMVTFLIDEKPAVVDGSLNKDLRITAVKYKERRSLDANAYLWVLCSKMAEKGLFDTSRQDVYEAMLQSYGTLMTDDDGNYVVVTIPSKVDIRTVQGHWLPFKQSLDGTFSSYLMIKGSSLYDRLEMSRLLDGTVREAKAMGIETMTPDDIERMKLTWNP